jgi:hypothetical protein
VVNIHKGLCALYGSCAVVRSTGGRWAKRVKASGSAETELRDLSRAGRPATTKTPDMLNCPDAIICADRCITTRQLALQLSINTGSVCSIIETLGYSKVCSTWDPRSLTTHHKIQRKTIPSELLERFDTYGEVFFPGSLQAAKPGYTFFSRRQKGSQWIGIVLSHPERRNFRQLLL